MSRQSDGLRAMIDDRDGQIAALRIVIENQAEEIQNLRRNFWVAVAEAAQAQKARDVDATLLPRALAQIRALFPHVEFTMKSKEPTKS